MSFPTVLGWAVQLFKAFSCGEDTLLYAWPIYFFYGFVSLLWYAGTVLLRKDW